MTERWKIMTKQGRVITLDIIVKTETHWSGIDKYGSQTMVAISEIADCFLVGDENS